MKNELFFLAHILVVVLFLLTALKKGEKFMIAFIALQGVLANFFVVKQIRLFSFDVTASDVYMIASILSLNLLREYFGSKQAKKTVYLSFFCMVFVSVMTQFQLAYIPNDFDWSHQSFVTIFSSTPRIVFSSIFVFFLVQRLDLLLFSFLKKAFKGRLLSIRILLSLVISQLLDTIVFSFLALYGLVGDLFQVILFSFLIKMFISFIATWFVMACQQLFVKQYEISEI